MSPKEATLGRSPIAILAIGQVFDEDEDFKKRAHEEVVRLQAGDGSSRYAWQQICDVSRHEFEKVSWLRSIAHTEPDSAPLSPLSPHCAPLRPKSAPGIDRFTAHRPLCPGQVYSRLDVKVREVGESYYNEYIPGVVKHLEEIGLISVDGGAKLIWPPGTKHENPLIVVKSDGGYGYDSTDMAAIWYRLLERKADWVIYVTDAGQASHFELIFAAAIAAGWTSEGTRLDHVPFGMVCGDDGKKFKTRSGDTVRGLRSPARSPAWARDVVAAMVPPLITRMRKPVAAAAAATRSCRHGWRRGGGRPTPRHGGAHATRSMHARRRAICTRRMHLLAGAAGGFIGRGRDADVQRDHGA